MKKKLDKYSCIRIGFYIVAAIFIVLLVNGKIRTSCYWYDTYGFMCPTCGMTRATISIFQFNIGEAINYNLFYTCVLFPIAMFLILNDICVVTRRIITHKNIFSIIEKISGKNGKWKKTYSVILVVLLVIFIAYGILRNFV